MEKYDLIEPSTKAKNIIPLQLLVGSLFMTGLPSWAIS